MDFLSRISNPIGVKLGPTTTADDALALQDKLNPQGLPGRLTFITRMGAGTIREALPPLVEKVTAVGSPVTWVTDPLHGNTITSDSGYKTRRLEDVLDEVDRRTRDGGRRPLSLLPVGPEPCDRGSHRTVRGERHGAETAAEFDGDGRCFE